MVLITHHMAEAAQAQRVIVMNDGLVAMDGTPEQVFAQVEKLHELGWPRRIRWSCSTACAGAAWTCR